jgi:TRAP-type mannitol/chloroaromatic compound transport system permease small subunit
MRAKMMLMSCVELMSISYFFLAETAIETKTLNASALDAKALKIFTLFSISFFLLKYITAITYLYLFFYITEKYRQLEKSDTDVEPVIYVFSCDFAY